MVEHPYRSPVALVPAPTSLADQVRRRAHDADMAKIGKILIKIRKRVERGKRVVLVRLWNNDAVFFKGPLRSASNDDRMAACKMLDDALYDDGLQVIFFIFVDGGHYKLRLGHSIQNKGVVDTSQWHDDQRWLEWLRRSTETSVQVSW